MSNDEERERWEPAPIPLGDGRFDIGDDTRAAIFRRLRDDFTLAAPWMTAEQRRQLAMLAAASVRALLHEIGTLSAMSQEPNESVGVSASATLPSLEHCSTMTDKQLAELLPTLSVKQRIEVVIAKYVGGAVSREYDGETDAPKADARIAAYLMKKIKPWLEQAAAPASVPPDGIAIYDSRGECHACGALQSLGSHGSTIDGGPCPLAALSSQLEAAKKARDEALARAEQAEEGRSSRK